MNSTLGTPSLARMGSGQAGLDWSIVSPMTPGNVVPGLYSLSAMCFSYLVTDVLRDKRDACCFTTPCLFLQLNCELVIPSLPTKSIRITGTSGSLAICEGDVRC